jgi:hypothetical protein
LPIEYSISLDLNLVFTRWFGNVDLDQFRELFAIYLEDENYLVGRPQFCDFSGITSMDADFNGIWSVLAMVNAPKVSLERKSKCVVFAPGDMAFAFSRIYQSLAEYEDGVQVTVCREEQEALAALGLADETIEEMWRRYNFLGARPKLSELGQG